MTLDVSLEARWPEPLLREWAASTLGAKRCSGGYLAALRVILGNMARADRLATFYPGVRLLLPLDVSFATKQTMRTIIGQLQGAGLLRRESWTDYAGHPHSSAVYAGQEPATPCDREPVGVLYERLQRDDESEGFRRFLTALGLQEADFAY